jgi:hydroxymethylbilane synthase
VARPVRLGTRGSLLALKQAELAASALRKGDRQIALETVEIRTEGDRDQTTPLTEVGGRGVFTSEIEQALIRDEVDVAVHSLKDLPTDEIEGILIGAVLERGDARDAVIARDGMFLHELAAGAVLGTSSSRRVAQLRACYPALRTESIRGNVDTRIKKLRRGEYDAIVLAAAGLERLDRLDEASEILEPDDMMPAPAQGAIALQCRSDDLETLNRLRAIDSRPTRAAVTAERAVLAMLDGGCSVPVGAYATVSGHELEITALVCSPDGEQQIRESLRGQAADPETVGRQLAGQLLDRGARDLLNQYAGAGT